MHIPEKSVYAVAATVALIAITTRVATTQTGSYSEPALVAQTEVADSTPSRYDNVARPNLPDPRAGVQKIKVAPLPEREVGKQSADSSTDVDSDGNTVIVDNPVREPNVDPSASADQDSPVRTAQTQDADGTVALTEESSPAKAGDLTDQAVYEMYVSSLDADDRRAFRATWALMSPEERQDWLQGARSALAGG